MMRVSHLLQALLLASFVFSTAAFAGPKKKPKPPAKEPAKVEKVEPTTTTTPPPSRRRDPEPDPDAGRRGPARIEFDDRLVQGQTNKANAIYLFERRESALRTLLKKRTHFHEQMDEMLEDELMK